MAKNFVLALSAAISNLAQKIVLVKVSFTIAEEKCASCRPSHGA